MADAITMRVNGTEHVVAVDPETPLIFVLRNDLGLIATRFGCGQSQCGACYVLVDGRVVASCEEPVGAVAGRSVITAESAESETLELLRRAFVAEQAAQCGYCLSGVLISGAALLDGRADMTELTDSTVRQALDGNLCRCGSHNRIVKAVLRAAEAR